MLYIHSLIHSLTQLSLRLVALQARHSVSTVSVSGLRVSLIRTAANHRHLGASAVATSWHLAQRPAPPPNGR